MTDDPSEQRLRAGNASLGAMGAAVGAIGPCLPALARDLDVSLDTAGFTLAAMAAGTVTAAAAVATRFHGGSQRRVAAAGAAALALALAGMAFAPGFGLFVAVAVMAGAGGGLCDAGTHGLAARAARPALAVSKLNRAFALGAMTGPAWAGAVLQAGGALWIVFAGLAAVAAAASALLLRAPDRPAPLSGASPGGFAAGLPAMVWAMSALLFLYVGAEFGLGGWVASATREAADASVLVAALVSSGYWGALWLGRMASGRALERGWRSERILVGSIAGAAAGSLLLAAAGHVVIFGAAGALLAGFCFGPIWPSALAIGTRSAPTNAPAAMVTIGNGGGVILPWLQGRVLVDAGPRAGMGVSAIICAAMLAVAAATLRWRPAQAAATASREPTTSR